MVAEAGDVLGDRGADAGLVELERPEPVEVVADGVGGGGKAGVIHVVVNDEDAEGVVEDPGAAVGKELDEAD